MPHRPDLPIRSNSSSASPGRAARVHRGLPLPSLRRRSARTLLPLLAAAAVAGCSGDSSEVRMQDVARRLNARTSGRPFTLPDETLRTAAGEPFNLRGGTRGQLVLLYFGYTFCPDVCPLQLAQANAAVAQLTEEEQARVTILFVTLDPERDTPERLEEWIEGMRSPAVALRGSPAELERVLGSTGYVMPPRDSWPVMEGAGSDMYLVPHPAVIFLITPDGLGGYQYPLEGTTPARIADDLRLLMQVNWRVPPPAPGASAPSPQPGEAQGPGADDGSGAGGTDEESEPGTGQAGGLTVRDAVIPATAGARSLAVYAEVENRGADDALVGIRAEPLAEVASLHMVETRDGMSSMRPMAEVPVPAGGTVSLRSGGLHGMLMELERVPAPGETVEVTFVFASGAELTVTVPVVALADFVPRG